MNKYIREVIKASYITNDDFIAYIKTCIKCQRLLSIVINSIEIIKISDLTNYDMKVSYYILNGNKLAIEYSSEENKTITGLVVLLYILYKNKNIKNIVVKNTVFNSLSNFNIKNNLDKFLNLIYRLDFTVYIKQDVIKLFPRSSLDVLI